MAREVLKRTTWYAHNNRHLELESKARAYLNEKKFNGKGDVSFGRWDILESGLIALGVIDEPIKEEG